MCLQEQVAALEDRLHILRRMNSQLERSASNAQQQTASAQHQVQRPKCSRASNTLQEVRKHCLFLAMMLQLILEM